MNKLMLFNIQLFAHKKGQSSTSNGRDSAGRRLGAKASDGEYVTAGSIIYRQRGTKIHPGTNVGRGTDDTLYSTISGYVKYSRLGKDRKQVSVYETKQNYLKSIDININYCYNLYRPWGISSVG